MSNKILLVSSLVFMLSCISHNEPQRYSIQGRLIVDSVSQGTEFSPYQKNNQDAYYPVYYLGKQIDTIFLGRQPISMYSNEELEARYDTAKNWNSLKDLNIQILVDTNTNAGHDIIFSHYPDDIDAEIVVDSIQSKKAFTVLVTNLSDSLVTVGSHNFLRFLTREVQDRDGNWIEVEKRMRGLCGSGKRILIMEPGDLIVTKLLRYEGKTKVRSRLVLRMKSRNDVYMTYSNVYWDYFDLDMLVSADDADHVKAL